MTEARPTFTDLLHELRERELRRLPSGARTVLHGGAAGGWYFKWFDENYDGDVERHIGVEYFADPPDDLPDNVEWLKRTLGDMGPVEDGSVDMVFGGQVIEHLWPDDVAGLLLESHRVLREGGHLVIDSPNRRVTEAIDWLHPQHTAELTVDEVAEMVRLAGFEIESIRGVLLGYDDAKHVFLGVEELGEGMPWDERADRAADRPEDSFVWWLVARRAGGEPAADDLRELCHDVAGAYRSRRLRKLQTALPVERRTGAEPVVERSDGGALFHGPYFPVDAGSWRVTFELRAPDIAGLAPDMEVVWLEATTNSGKTKHARRVVRAHDLRPDGGWTEVELDVTLDEMLLGVEFPVTSYGTTRVQAKLNLRFEAAADASEPLPPPPPPPPPPEPRVREMAERIVSRSAEGARHRVSQKLKRS